MVVYKDKTKIVDDYDIKAGENLVDIDIQNRAHTQLADNVDLLRNGIVNLCDSVGVSTEQDTSEPSYLSETYIRDGMAIKDAIIKLDRAIHNTFIMTLTLAPSGTASVAPSDLVDFVQLNIGEPTSVFSPSTPNYRLHPTALGATAYSQAPNQVRFMVAVDNYNAYDYLQNPPSFTTSSARRPFDLISFNGADTFTRPGIDSGIGEFNYANGTMYTWSYFSNTWYKTLQLFSFPQPDYTADPVGHRHITLGSRHTVTWNESLVHVSNDSISANPSRQDSSLLLNTVGGRNGQSGYISSAGHFFWVYRFVTSPGNTDNIGAYRVANIGESSTYPSGWTPADTVNQTCFFGGAGSLSGLPDSLSAADITCFVCEDPETSNIWILYRKSGDSALYRRVSTDGGLNFGAEGLFTEFSIATDICGSPVPLLLSNGYVLITYIRSGSSTPSAAEWKFVATYGKPTGTGLTEWSTIEKSISLPPRFIHRATPTVQVGVSGDIYSFYVSDSTSESSKSRVMRIRISFG
jgi:hypothetical protein